MPRVLFVVKQRAGYSTSPDDSNYCSSGLLNSATFVVDMLQANGVDAELIEAVDNNAIDKAVHDFKPQVVIIEAFWVVPEKFDVLVKLHPHVQWIVRGHSNLPFLANEGIAIGWIFGYLRHRNVSVAFNAPEITKDFQALTPSLAHKVLYLPNFYPTNKRGTAEKSNDIVLKVGCFGAIRPLKNQLIQAVAAIRFADELKRPLKFYMNVSRLEEGGNNVLKNIRALFTNTGHRLVEVDWLTHPDFLKLVRKMDVAMAVSLSETFCITAADAVAEGVPLVCSKEVPWASHLSVADATSSNSIIARLHRVTGYLKRPSRTFNFRNLRDYSQESKRIWLKFFS